MKMHLQELHLCSGMHAENKKNNLTCSFCCPFFCLLDPAPWGRCTTCTPL